MATMPKAIPNVVSIQVSRDGHAKPDPATLKHSHPDEAEFCSQDDVTVRFNSPKGTPFLRGDTFAVKAGTCTGSGPLKPGADGHYPYHVDPEKGTGSGADPTIIVTN